MRSILIHAPAPSRNPPRGRQRESSLSGSPSAVHHGAFRFRKPMRRGYARCPWVPHPSPVLGYVSGGYDLERPPTGGLSLGERSPLGSALTASGQRRKSPPPPQDCPQHPPARRTEPRMSRSLALPSSLVEASNLSPTREPPLCMESERFAEGAGAAADRPFRRSPERFSSTRAYASQGGRVGRQALLGRWSG